MQRSILISSAMGALVGLANVGHTQTPITTFAEVAGKWTGQTAPSHYSFTLEIDPVGRFKAKSSLGSENGIAKLEEGTIVISLTEHQGQLQLFHVGETLTGPGVLRSTKGSVRLVRAD